MTRITADKQRDIIDDFAEEIAQRRELYSDKGKVIPFRNDEKLNKTRSVYIVKTDLLRFRKDNGRIASEVESYENLKQPLEEDEEETQKIISGFLNSKDREETKTLMQALKRDGQQEPAIITCDGFLINGNRRKLALDMLYEDKKDEHYRSMKVVILPGKNDKDEGGPPTLLEIEEIENRCQLQKEGKAEYSHFNQALSVRKKMNMGMKLEAILRDDPRYYDLPHKSFKRAMTQFKKEYLDPLQCVDDYLESIDSTGLYNLISQGEKDNDGGRWQAFVDYSKSVEEKLKDNKKRRGLGLGADEYGIFKDIAFKIIRVRDFKNMQKLHELMRKYPKMLKNTNAKKEIESLSHIDMPSPNVIDGKADDADWLNRYRSEITKRVWKANKHLEYDDEKDKPISILEDILESLQREEIRPETIGLEDLTKAHSLMDEIKDIADELKKEYWSTKKKNSPEQIKKRLSDKFGTQQNR